MENKIPFYRFNGNECDCSGDYLEEMSQITFEDIKSLSHNQLDNIPTSYICDWANEFGHIKDPEVRLFINRLYEERKQFKRLQLLKKNTQIEFVRIGNGTIQFLLHTKKNNKLKCEVYYNTCYVNSTAYRLPNRQLTRFQEAYGTFRSSYEDAQKGINGFLTAKLDKETIYLRRLLSFEYQFIVERHDQIIARTCTIFDYFKSEIYNPSLDIEDEYFMTELKFYRGVATKDEITYLNNIDGKNRIASDNKIYGTEDVEIKAIKLLPKSFFHCIDEYDIKLIIDGRVHSAVYLSGNILKINGYNSSASVIITNELRDYIQTKNKR